MKRKRRNVVEVKKEDSSSENDDSLSSEDDENGIQVRQYIPDPRDVPISDTKPVSLSLKHTGQQKSISNWNIFGVIVVLMAILMMAFYLNYKPPVPDVPVHDYELSPKEKILEKYIDQLEQEFPSQDDDTWFAFRSGIKSVIREEPNKPSVFLLLYESDEKTAKCLAVKVSQIGIRYLTGTSGSPLILSGQDLRANSEFNKDSGEMIVKYKRRIEVNSAMVVTELHEVPGSIAKAFHFFCDKESPLVDRAVYFFTLKNYGISTSTLLKTAEKTLKMLWNESLSENLLAPLITRLSGNIIQIHPEYHITDCNL